MATRATTKKAETKTSTAAAPKKPAVRRKASKPVTETEVYVQFWGKEVHVKDVVESIHNVWTNEMGKDEKDLKDLKIYIKPEDNGAHYVINDDITGFLGL